MGRLQYSILSAGLIFGTFVAQASPSGNPQDYKLRTKYSCQANGITVHSKNKLISNGSTLREVKFTAPPGGSQALSLNNREYMIWPRAIGTSFGKSINVLARDADTQKYRIIQEIELSDSQKTKTSVGVTVKDRQGEERLVSCQVEMEWLKKNR
jgi:hypothetical protein